MLTLISFLITISIVVVFHEWGHYLACRLFGIHVERFSLGFGKVVYKVTDSKGCQWALSALPLGGYVKPLSKESEYYPQLKTQYADKLGRTIESVNPWQRFAVYAAGPLFSFILAILIYTGLNLKGQEEVVAVLAEPAPTTVAAQSGIRQGDLIVAVDGKAVYSWSQLNETLLDAIHFGQTAEVEVLRSLDTQSLPQHVRDIERQLASYPRETLHLSFVAPGGTLENRNLLLESGLAIDTSRVRVVDVLPDSAAQRAGLLTGDIITGICSTSTDDESSAANSDAFSLQRLMQTFREHPEQSICLELLRDGATLTAHITPTAVEEEGQRFGRAGVRLGADLPTITVRYGPVDSISHAVSKTYNLATMSFKVVGRMITGDVSWRNLSGPITIADYSGQVAHAGVWPFISFIALISLSIGVLNLLPVPALDGGQMVICFLEGIRGKPLPERVLQPIYALGYALLLGLMVLAFTSDIFRLL